MDFKIGEWYMLDENKQSGVSTWIMDDGEDLNIQTRQDVNALLDENKAIRNMASDNWKGDWHSVARVPLSMMHDTSIGEALRAGDDKFVTAKLNDSDYANLRTKEGKL